MDGASLSLVHTDNDLSAISHYRSVIGSYIWVGLRIKAGKKLHCVNATCNGELKWDDNTTFMHDPQVHNIQVDNGGASCFVMDSGDKLDDVNCDRGRNFICQATCTKTTTTTTTSTITNTTIACLIEENIDYKGSDINDGFNDKQKDAENCRSFCESNYPTATYFGWFSPLVGWVRGRNTCWCKTSNTAKLSSHGQYSGEICRGATTLASATTTKTYNTSTTNTTVSNTVAATTSTKITTTIGNTSSKLPLPVEEEPRYQHWRMIIIADKDKYSEFQRLCLQECMKNCTNNHTQKCFGKAHHSKITN